MWCAGPVTEEELKEGLAEAKKNKWKQDTLPYHLLHTYSDGNTNIVTELMPASLQECLSDATSPDAQS